MPKPLDTALKLRQRFAIAYSRASRYVVDRQTTALDWPSLRNWWKLQQKGATVDISSSGGLSIEEARLAVETAARSLPSGHKRQLCGGVDGLRPGVYVVPNDSLARIETLVGWPIPSRYDERGVSAMLVTDSMISTEPGAWRGQLAKMGAMEPDWFSNTLMRQCGDLIYVHLTENPYRLVTALLALKAHVEYLASGKSAPVELASSRQLEHTFFLDQWSTSIGASFELQRAASHHVEAELVPSMLDMLKRSTVESIATTARELSWEKSAIIIEGKIEALRPELVKLGLPVHELSHKALDRLSKP